MKMNSNQNFTVALHNLGCKVNSYEAEAMLSEMKKAGFAVVPWEERADVYIINTCSVTNIADRKSRQMLHKAKSKNPAAVVVGVGCYVQAKAEELALDGAVDILIGNNRKNNIVEIVEAYLRERNSKNQTAGGEGAQRGTPGVDDGDAAGLYPEAEASEPVYAEQKSGHLSSSRDGAAGAQRFVPDIASETEYESLYAADMTDRARAFIKVQDGCNQFCTYCIIPLVRGRIRSRSIQDTVREVQELAAAGYREVVLTGIHLSSYGIDFENRSYEYHINHAIPSEQLLALIRAVASVQGIERVRLGSLEPRIITREFVQALAAIPEICPHFHLSLQSGCDKTLRAMNRHYTTEQFRESCRILREVFQDVAITTDVIVGFPGETEADFEESRRFIEEIGFYELHVFKYSRRAGTVADRMPEQLTDRVKSRRSDQLLDLDARQSADFRKRFIGKVSEVLIEALVEEDGVHYLTGFNREYVKYLLPVENSREADGRIGTIMQLKASEICKSCILAKNSKLV